MSRDQQPFAFLFHPNVRCPAMHWMIRVLPRRNRFRPHHDDCVSMHQHRFYLPLVRCVVDATIAQQIQNIFSFEDLIVGRVHCKVIGPIFFPSWGNLLRKMQPTQLDRCFLFARLTSHCSLLFAPGPKRRTRVIGLRVLLWSFCSSFYLLFTFDVAERFESTNRHNLRLMRHPIFIAGVANRILTRILADKPPDVSL